MFLRLSLKETSSLQSLCDLCMVVKVQYNRCFTCFHLLLLRFTYTLAAMWMGSELLYMPCMCCCICPSPAGLHRTHRPLNKRHTLVQSTLSTAGQCRSRDRNAPARFATPTPAVNKLVTRYMIETTTPLFSPLSMASPLKPSGRSSASSCSRTRSLGAKKEWKRQRGSKSDRLVPFSFSF